MTVRCLIVDASDRFLQAVRVMLEREGIDVVGVVVVRTEAGPTPQRSVAPPV
jgi:hypothetical protein